MKYLLSDVMVVLLGFGMALYFFCCIGYAPGKVEMAAAGAGYIITGTYAVWRLFIMVFRIVNRLEKGTWIEEY